MDQMKLISMMETKKMLTRTLGLKGITRIGDEYVHYSDDRFVNINGKGFYLQRMDRIGDKSVFYSDDLFVNIDGNSFYLKRINRIGDKSVSYSDDRFVSINGNSFYLQRINRIGNKIVVYSNDKIERVGNDYVVYNSNYENEISQLQSQLQTQPKIQNNHSVVTKPILQPKVASTFFCPSKIEKRTPDTRGDRGTSFWYNLKTKYDSYDQKGLYFFDHTGWKKEIEDGTGEYQVYEWQLRLISNYQHGELSSKEKDEYIIWFRTPSTSSWINKRSNKAITCFFLCINPNEMTENEYSELWLKRDKIHFQDVDVMLFQNRIKQMDELDSQKSCFKVCNLF
jgi:hypothetical protein